jgi:hypothetical protein
MVGKEGGVMADQQPLFEGVEPRPLEPLDEQPEPKDEEGDAE